MSEQNNNQGNQVNQPNRCTYKTKARRRLITIIILAVVAFVLLLTTCCIISAQSNNMYVSEQTCTTCGRWEAYCICATTIQNLEDQIEYLESNGCAGDDECRDCPMHCPDYYDECEHESATWVQGYSTLEIVKTKRVCLIETRVDSLICDDCDAVLDTEEYSSEDTTHYWGGDNKCDDCGYVKSSDNGGNNGGGNGGGGNGGNKPDEPTKEPPQTPTSCKHPNKKSEESDWSKWSSVGTADICREKQRTVKVICPDCGEVLSKETEYQCDYDHSFKGAGCQDCSYKRPKQEASASASGTIPSTSVEWEIEDGSGVPAPVE